MPNTLAHFGIQAVASRSISHNADLRWIFTGCVIPDVPWILQRLVQTSGISLDLYDLRIYAIIQASLFCSLLLCGALAFLSFHPKRVFAILACNVLGHLILDAMQTKWGNGVHLFAPISWTMWNAGWFWPESIITYGLTMLGLAYVLWMWRGFFQGRLINLGPKPKYLGLAMICFMSYMLLPFLMMSGPEIADNHFVHTLRAKETRQGKAIEFDRVSYNFQAQDGSIRTFAKENIQLHLAPLDHSGTISLKGRFADQSLIRVDEWHIHVPFFRDAASVIGLVLLAFLWLYSFFIKSGTHPYPQEQSFQHEKNS